MKNAMVTVPLSEVDALREENRMHVKVLAEMQDTEKKIKVEIREHVIAQREVRYGAAGSYSRIENYNTWKDHPHTYINLDEVIKPIRDEEEAKVAENTRRLEQTVKDLVDQYQKEKTKYRDEIKHLNEKHLEALAVATGKNKKATVDGMNNMTIQDLGVKLLSAELAILKRDHQGFFGRVFNPIR